MATDSYWTRFQRERISRRRLLGAAGIGAAGLAIAAACGDGDDGGVGDAATATPGAPGAEETPRAGGILRLRQALAYPNLSPFDPGLGSLSQGLFVGFTIYDHLWYVPTDTGEVVPFLADDIEVIDAQTIRVHMGEAVFHDLPPVNGRDVRSSDVKASLLRFREVPPVGFSWLQEVFERMDTPDDRTVVYHQNRPWAWFFTASNAGSPISSSILPEEVLDDEEIYSNRPIGSGRWVMTGHDNFTNIRLRKFENWREPGLPLIDGIDYSFISDTALALAALAAKDIDLLGLAGFGGVTRIEAESLSDRFGDEIIILSDLSRSYRVLMIKHEGPFRDERVRHGINLAINRDEIRQALNLGDGEFSGPLPPAHTKFALDESDPDLQEYFRHDPADAKAMLAAADFPFDEEIEIKYATSASGISAQLAQVLQQQFSAVGMNVKVPPGEELIRWLTQTLAPGNFQMTAFTQLPYEDPSLPLSFYLGSEAAAQPNFMGYQDDEVDLAILAAAEELDEEQRVEKTKEAQRVIIRKWGPQLTLYSPISFGARWDYVKGVVSGRGSFGLFNSRLWLDK